eukprot:TRINITY_DN5456_c0_g1_i2.p1 TRINITY_DN5456_c0_g1~~TRINITY_DN5456_c0_g1_i2.p1  ORF type:complete len:257 (+),score=45.24 TRINITY_DN5456_c0_g1_i2:98-868(+)
MGDLRYKADFLSSNDRDEGLQKLLKHTFLVLALPENEARLVADAFEVSKKFFSSPLPQNLKQAAKLGYKKNLPKERFQVRRTVRDDHFPTSLPEFKTLLLGVYDLFERIANELLKSILLFMGINHSELMSVYGDPNPPKLSSSVLNVFNYFNSSDIEKTVNCREHIDPGLITVLGKGTVGGLLVRDPTRSDVTWISVEDLMEPSDVIILTGQTLNFLTGGKVEGNLHWVGKNTSSRVNITFELRLAYPIYLSLIHI